MGRLVLEQQDTQAAPAVGDTAIYVKTDGKAYKKDSSGTETGIADGSTPGDHADSHKGGGSDEIDAATTGVNGLMSSTDKTKLDGVAAGADVTGSNAPQAHATTHIGGGADAIANATISVSGLMSGADKTKLDGIATGADVTGSNAPQAHAASHQNGGADEISVAGLSGVLADGQNAEQLDGYDLTITSPTLRNPIVYDPVADEFFNQKQFVVPHGNVIAKDTTLTWTDFENGYKFTPVNTEPQLSSHVGNGTVSYLNGITPTAGDSYTVTDSGVLTTGSLPVSTGFVVVYSGTAWVYGAPPENGYVYPGLMVQLSSTTALISPYTDGTDDGKLIAFDGTDLTGVETTQDITITLPDPAGLPKDDNTILGMCYVGKMKAGGTVTVDVLGTGGVFMDGLESVLLEDQMQQTTIACVNATLASVWMRISTIPDTLQVRRAATWSATNFSSPTPLPFDTEDIEGNPSVSDWDTPTNPSRLVAKYAKTYTFSGFINIDTTGGATWIFEAWLRKNGTTEVPGSRIRTGNYQGEDMAVTMPPIQVDLAVDDYIEVVCDHTSLTGQIFSAAFTMYTTY